MSISDRLRTVPTLTGTPPHLDLGDLPSDPHDLALAWLDAAIDGDVPEPIAVTLATVDADGVPDARTLLLKDVDERGWAFAGTGSSRKADHLADNPAAALNLWWQAQMRAVRVRGPVVEASPQECEADLAGRSPQARAAVPPGSGGSGASNRRGLDSPALPRARGRRRRHPAAGRAVLLLVVAGMIGVAVVTSLLGVVQT